MQSTVDGADDMTTKFQTESDNNSEVITPLAELGSVVPGYIIRYKMGLVAVGVLGTFTNAVVLAGFWLAGRSKMNSSSAHIANHTTLEEPTFPDLRGNDSPNRTEILFLTFERPEYTTLELFGTVNVIVRFSMDIAGVFTYYGDSSPAGKIVCILFHGATLITTGTYGGTACIVIVTFDRFWKIVYPVHHRKYYRPWMLKVGLFLPWLNGVAVNLLPALGTSGIVNGKCFPLSFWPSVWMNKGHRLFLFIWQFCLPLIACMFAYWKIFKVVRRQAKVETARQRVKVLAKEPVAGTSAGKTETTNSGATKEKSQKKKGVSIEAVVAGPSGQRQQAGGQEMGLSQAKLNVIKTVIYIIICFIVCLMPKNLYLTYKNLRDVSLVSPRRLPDPAANIVTIMAHCNVFLNSLVYIIQYDVVRVALRGFGQRIVAKFKNQQPPGNN